MSDDEDMGPEEIVTEEMLWERIPEVTGIDRANTYYELSARIYARGQYDEALALAETARDLYAEADGNTSIDGLAQAYSAIGYNLNQLKRINEAADAMSKAVELLRESKSPLAIDLACTLGDWWYGSKNYKKAIECMQDCVQEHLVEGDDSGAANDLHLIGCSYRELKEFSSALEAFREARVLFKKLKEVINVARCDLKIAFCLNAFGDGEGAQHAAQKAIDVFATAHDHNREMFAQMELGKAFITSGQLEQGYVTLEKLLGSMTADQIENRDFEFIVEIEEKMAEVLKLLGREAEAVEIERRLASVKEVIED